MSDVDPNVIFREFWEPIVGNPDDTLNVDQVILELADYHTLLGVAPKVYMHVTGGRLSKPNYTAESVMSAFDSHVEDLQRRWMADLIADLTDGDAPDEIVAFLRGWST